MNTRKILGIGLLVAGFAYMASQSKKKTTAPKKLLDFGGKELTVANAELTIDTPRR